MKKIIFLLISLLVLFGCSDKEIEEQVVENEAKETTEEVVEVVEEVAEEDRELELELKYLDMTNQMSNQSYDILGEISNMMNNAHSNPSLLGDDGWKRDFGLLFSLFELQHARLLDAEVPARFEEIHEKMLLSYSLKIQSGEKMIQGVNELEVSLLEEGMELMAISTELISEVTSLIENLD